jgi:hypothetical protein
MTEESLGVLTSPGKETRESDSGRINWWESKLVLSILALIIPLTTLIKGGVETYKANLIAQNHQEHQVQMEYLTLVTRTDLGLRNQALVLRFLKNTARQKETRTWASSELKVIETNEKEIASDLDKHKQQQATLESEIGRLEKTLLTVNATPIVSHQLKLLKDTNDKKELEIARMARKLDNPAIFPAQIPQNIHYRCSSETIKALGSSTDDERRKVCANSLPADSLPLDGSFDVGGLSYSWTANGITCLCRVVISPAG